MSLSSTTNLNIHTTAGGVSAFAYTFKIQSESDLRVVVHNTSTSEETLLTLNTHYTVSGVGGVSGGNVTLIGTGNAWQESGLTSLSSVYKIVLRRVAKLVQETDIRNQGAFYPETHENQFDATVMSLQAHQNEIDRSFKLAEGVNPTSFDAKLPVSSAGASIGNRYLMTNEDGDGLKLGPSLTAAGSGDVTGPVASVADELPLYDGTTGKLLKRASGTGAVYTNSGVVTQGTLPVSMGGTGVTSLVFPFTNYAQNAQFRFFQRTDPFTLTNITDGNYGPDRFKIYTESGNVQCAQVEVGEGSFRTRFALQLRQADATPRRFGVIQKLLMDNCVALRGKTVTFSFVAKTDGTEITTLRAGIIQWTGSGNNLTNDLVSSWAATPTLVADAAFVNTPADLTISSAFAKFSITVTLGTTFNNLALFIWTPNAEAQNDDFYLKEIQLIPFSSATPFENCALTYDEDLAQCHNFYQKSYSITIAPGTVFPSNVSTFKAHTTTHLETIKMYRPMFGGPTVTYFNPSSGASGSWRDTSAAADRTVTTALGSSTSVVASVAATVDGNTVIGHWTLVREL